MKPWIFSVKIGKRKPKPILVMVDVDIDEKSVAEWLKGELKATDVDPVACLETLKVGNMHFSGCYEFPRITVNHLKALF